MAPTAAGTPANAVSGDDGARRLALGFGAGKRRVPSCVPVPLAHKFGVEDAMADAGMALTFWKHFVAAGAALCEVLSKSGRRRQ